MILQPKPQDATFLSWRYFTTPSFLVQPKNTLRIKENLAPCLFFRNTFNFCNFLNNLRNIHGLIALATMRCRRYIGRVGFGQKHIERRVFYNLVVVVSKRNDAREGEREA